MRSSLERLGPGRREGNSRDSGFRVAAYMIECVTRALNSGYVAASDHVAIDLDQGY